MPPWDSFLTMFSLDVRIRYDTSLTPGISESLVDGDFDRGVSVYADDIDGDGDTDVLGAAWCESGITWWENADGCGTCRHCPSC